MAKVFYVRAQGFWVVMPTTSERIATEECERAQGSSPVMLSVLFDDEAVVVEQWPGIKIRREEP